MVVNASRKDHDYGWIEARLPAGVTLAPRDDLALVALQGPKAEAVMAKLAPELADLKFMHSTDVAVKGLALQVSRSGYTGEDGYEISLAARDAARLVDAAAGGRAGEARWPGCARFAAARGGPLPLWP